MAYRVNVYFNSEYIASTRIRSGSFIDETRYYGDDAYIADGFTDTTSFTATPADGCEFVKWYYRIGGDSGTLQESTDNPFRYSGTEEIIIRAVGQPISGGDSGGGDDTWTLNDGTFGSIDDTAVYTQRITVVGRVLHRYSATFTKSGTALFRRMTRTNDNELSYLSKSTSWDVNTGTPINTIGNMDDGVELAVTAGDVYYVWVRAKDPERSDANRVAEVIRFTVDTIPKWDWYSSDKTLAAYNAINNKGSTKNFSHDVWDAMVDKVKAICDEVVGWWDSASYGLSYANTKAKLNSNGEYVLTSQMFNTLRNNLEIAGTSTMVNLSKIPTGTLSGQIPHPVNTGDKVYGHYFITLANYINSCIDKL